MVVERSGLSKLEVFSCSLIWISAVIYASYNVFQAGKFFDMSKNGDDFGNGWFLGYKKDRADIEWDSWITMIRFLIPWYLFHIILTEFTRWVLIEALPVCYIMITNLILFNLFGFKIVLYIFLKILIQYFMLTARSYMLTWIFNTSYLLFLSFGFPYLLDVMNLKFSTSDFYFTAVTFSWVQLKCASFSLEFLKNQSSKLNINSLLLLLSYSYYLPLYFFGPLMLYSEFEKGIKRPFVPWTLKRILFAIINILRYLFWIAMVDLFLHFFYIHALEYNLPWMKMRGVWHLHGLAYLLGAFFCIKYTAMYGLTRTLSAIEGHSPPPTPECVFHVYRNSQMWRTFDVGYYQFIKRYIYMPILEGSKSLIRRFYAAAAAFSYVYLWHGTTENVFFWSLLNFIQVSVVESVFTEISRSSKFRVWLHDHFSEKNILRLTAALYAPLYLFFMTANSFFFVMDGGYYLMIQFLEGSWSFLIIFNIFSYCFCITAIHINQYLDNKDESVLKTA